MEDVVAIEATVAGGSKLYCMTWGRVFGPDDPTELLRVVHPLIVQPEDEPASLRVCETLQEASGAPYFFEALIFFGQRNIPFGPGYSEWEYRMRAAVKSGKQVYRLGRAGQ
jgi:hypothetical protein